MLITKSSGIASKVLRTRGYNKGTTFQLAATEAVMSGMTDIVFEIPDSDFDPSTIEDGYSGDWVPLYYGGESVVLNSNNRAVTLYGTIVLRVSKTVDEEVGVHWAW